ncbi:MAG: arylsulfatase [Kiritimatiellia bacterium]
MNRRAFLKTLGLGISTLAMPGYAFARPASTCPRNIVLILADDLGWGDVSCYGSTPQLTPFIDAFAQTSIRFTDAHSPAATCTPTRYAILTGQYAWRKPGTGIAPGDSKLLIDRSQVTLPKLMQQSGMVTGAIGKWHLGMGPGPGKTDWNKPIHPSANDVGFNYTFLMAATADRTPCVYVENGTVVGLDPSDPLEVNYQHNYQGEPDGKKDRATLKMDWDVGHNMAVVNGIGRIGYMKGAQKARWKDEEMADLFVAKAQNFITENKDRPFFLYLATNDIHVPRVPHPRFVGSTPFGSRGDATRQFDDSVRRVVETVQQLGLENDTLIVITSDNGPMVNDGYKDQADERLGNHLPSGNWRGHKYTPYEGGHRLPFIVHWKGVTPENTFCPALFSLVDLGRTFAMLRNAPPAPNTLPDSFDQRALFFNPQAASARTSLICQDGQLSFREGSWKYIVPASAGNNATEKTPLLKGQLYDLATDPAEKHNRIADDPSRAKALFEKLLAAIKAGKTFQEK